VILWITGLRLKFNPLKIRILLIRTRLRDKSLLVIYNKIESSAKSTVLHINQLV